MSHDFLLFSIDTKTDENSIAAETIKLYRKN